VFADLEILEVGLECDWKSVWNIFVHIGSFLEILEAYWKFFGNIGSLTENIGLEVRLEAFWKYLKLFGTIGSLTGNIVSLLEVFFGNIGSFLETLEVFWKYWKLY
jgi:hypothetical protein